MIMDEPLKFTSDQIAVVSRALATAEDLVSEYYKLSATRMRQLNYDVKTAAELSQHEIVRDHFAQIVRYRTERRNSLLRTDAEDFYKICLQDHSILSVVNRFARIGLYEFLLYVICHELIHVVRFRRFQQRFDVPEEQKQAEEVRVHKITHEILEQQQIPGMPPVFEFYENWWTTTDVMVR
ncbi:MAG: hypothetical protein K9J79_09420 [Desulfobacteraceae bacterium]|nr:hypothetical protein [Desulfobacteraceae bacterium]